MHTSAQRQQHSPHSSLTSASLTGQQRGGPDVPGCLVYVYMGVLPVCTSVYCLCAWHPVPNEGISFPRTGATDVNHHVHAENQSLASGGAGNAPTH